MSAREPALLQTGDRRVVRCVPVALSVLAAAFVAVGPARAGWVVDWAAPGAGSAVQQQDSLQANRLKIVWFGAGGKPVVALIVDLNANIFTHVYHEKRYYVVQTPEEYLLTIRAIRKMALGLWPASPELIEAMKRASPDERKKLEEQLKAYEQKMRASGWGQPDPAPEECPAPRIEGRSLGQQAKIAGHAAVRYEVLIDGKPSNAFSEIWLARGIAASRELDPKKLRDFLREIAKAMPPCSPGGDPVEVLAHNPAWALIDEGYPVRLVGRTGGVAEVAKVETRAIPAPEFSPPAGFAQKTYAEHIGQ